MAKKNRTPAVAYLRTSSSTNVGADKDSDKRQRSAIEAFRQARALVLGHWAAFDGFRDRLARGAQPVSGEL